jgi:hypothetical protein
MTRNDPLVSSIVRSPVSTGHGDTPYTAEEAGWRGLAAAIIRQALLDARGTVLDIRVKSADTRTMRESAIAEAREWLTRDNACLRFVCRLAGINHVAVLEKARKEFGEPNDCQPYQDADTGRKIGDARPAKAGAVPCDCGLRCHVLDRHRRVVLPRTRKRGRPTKVDFDA